VRDAKYGQMPVPFPLYSVSLSVPLHNDSIWNANASPNWYACMLKSHSCNFADC
jgi:hypothetical protein